MVFLDADVQVYENIDDLFDLPDGHVYAVMDCTCEWPAGPQHPAGYCQYSPNRVPWPPEMGGSPSLYFNAGVFVFEPSKFTCASLIQTIAVAPVTFLAEQVKTAQKVSGVYCWPDIISMANFSSFS